jgi:pheromone shutdown protein TraB
MDNLPNETEDPDAAFNTWLRKTQMKSYFTLFPVCVMVIIVISIITMYSYELDPLSTEILPGWLLCSGIIGWMEMTYKIVAFIGDWWWDRDFELFLIQQEKYEVEKDG